MVLARVVVNARTAPVFLIPVIAPAAASARTVAALMTTANVQAVVNVVTVAVLMTIVSVTRQTARNAAAVSARTFADSRVVIAGTVNIAITEAVNNVLKKPATTMN